MSAAAEIVEESRRYVVFAVVDRRIAVAVEDVSRVLQVVEITPVGDLPAAVIGAINLHGEAVPAIDMRRRLGLPVRDVELTDQLVLVQRDALSCFLLCDGVVGVVEFPRAMVRPRNEAGAEDCCSAEVRLEEGVVSLLDVSRLLTGPQAEEIRRALSRDVDR